MTQRARASKAASPPTASARFRPAFGTGAAGFAQIEYRRSLLGMHQRLATENARLVDEVNQAAEDALRDLQRLVQATSYDRIGDVDRALSSMLRVRETVAHLSTWPWKLETGAECRRALAGRSPLG